MRALAAIVLASGLAAGMAWGVAEAAPLEHCVKAEEAYQAGNHALEIEFYTRCIEDEGPRGIKLAIAQNNRGVAHLAVGDPDSAIEDYDRALANTSGELANQTRIQAARFENLRAKLGNQLLDLSRVGRGD